MIGQIIQSYLVSLGVQVDRPGFQQADQTIRRTGETVERVTGGMARDFVKASTIITSAIASVTAAAVGLMKAAATEDLAMQKYARSMMMSEDAAWRMKKATDALGESINDIALTPELLGRFTQLTADGSKMKVGGDFKQTMKDFRDLIFEFTRLKQEASYALNWVGYYLMKYLQKPLADIREKFKAFNDSVIKNMSVWTEKVARAIFYVIEVGRHLLEFIRDIGRAVFKLWDSFPSGVKKAIAAIAALNVVLSAGPLGRGIMLISTLLLLIDDYYGYMEGKNAAFGKYWDKLNEYLEKGKILWEQLKTKAEPYWDMLVDYAGRAKDWLEKLIDSAWELKDSFSAWMDETGSDYLSAFIDGCKDLWGILSEIGASLSNTVVTALKELRSELEKNGTINDMRKALERLWRIFKMLYQAGKDLIRFCLELWRELEKSQEIHDFRAAVMELVDAVVELFGAIMAVVETALRAFFGEFNKTDKVTSFRDVLRSVAKALTLMAKGISSVIRWLTQLFNKVAQNKTFIEFWKKVADAIDTVVKKAGKLGRAFGALLEGNPKKAWEILKTLGDKEPEKSSAGSKISDDPRVAVAEKVAELTGADPALIYGNMVAESGYWQGDDTLSTLAKKHHNYGGIKYYGNDPSKVAFEATDGGVFRHFDSDEEYARYMAETISAYSGAVKARNERDYVIGLKNRDEDGADYTGGADLEHYASMVKSGADYYRELPSRGVRRDARQNNLAGDAAAENAEAAIGERVEFYNPNAGTTIQCDSFTAHIYNQDGIETIGGHSTDSESGGVINDDAFIDSNAFHPAGDGYEPQNGDLVAYTRSETSGHYGIYSNGHVISRDSSGVVRSRTLEEWENDFGLTGYGSIAEAEAYRKAQEGGVMQTAAYTTEKPNIVPLGMATANSLIPSPYKDDVTAADLASIDDPRLVKVGTPQAGVFCPISTAPQATDDTLTVYLKQVVSILTSIRNAIQSIGGALPIGELTDKLPDLRGDLTELGKMGMPIFEDMQSGFSPTAILHSIGGAVGGNTTDIKIDMGGITVNGAGDPEATARAVFRHADQDMRFIAANRLGGNHGLVSI